MHPKELEHWNHNRVKTIIDFYGHRFFLGKKILDIGSYDGAIANAFSRLGARVTCVDARKEHLTVINKNFPHLRTIQMDLDNEWNFDDFEFDLVLSLGTMCHLKDLNEHLNRICSAAEHIVLETEVLDTADKNSFIEMIEDRNVNNLSFNGKVTITNALTIQNTLYSIGATFKRVDETKLNSGPYKYDWAERGIGRKFGNRRMWFIKRDKYIAQKMKIATLSTKIKKETNNTSTVDSNIIQVNNIQTTDNLLKQIESAPPLQEKINNIPAASSTNKKFVIVIPSYKNSQYCEKNIQSSLDQNYDNYRIIFTDDCSPDDTFVKVSNIVGASSKTNLVTLIKNQTRIGALENLYNMIHSCDDDEIILTLDGDDWFPDRNVLNKLNRYYSTNDIWMTYGQYKNSTDGHCGVAQQYPDHIIKNNNFRHHVWSASHLRTFYTWLFKKIRKEDLCQDGKFFAMTWDFAIMFPMLEMAGEHSKYLSDILYTYNLSNPINDHKVNIKLQHDLDRHIRNMPKYSRVNPPPIKPIKPPKINVGLLLIATGKYDKFIQGLIDSADKLFITNENYNITYYVFTDRKDVIRAESRSVVIIPIEHKPFPYASMDRFKHFTNHSDKLIKEDYLCYVDVDCLFVDSIQEDILGDLIGVRHCGYYRIPGPREPNPRSKLYVDEAYPKKFIYYYGGGFSGGKRNNYLALSKWCSEMIDVDVRNGIIPIWHDETAINRYFLDNPPTIVLSPSYHYPQSDIQRYKKMWEPDVFSAKILLLDKNHNEIRK